MKAVWNEFSFVSCPGLVSQTFASDLFSDRSEAASDMFSPRSETNGPPPKVIAKPEIKGHALACQCTGYVRGVQV